MSRLTNKYFSINPPRSIKKCRQDFYVAIEDKLRMLENIEDELGCPLETVFKGLKNGVYWILDDGMHRIDFTKTPRSLMFDGDGWFIFEGWFDIGCPIRLYFKDYGKKDGGGWALTREELEK